MGQALDVYRDWLGIVDGPRPPDHYTLLGVPRGESDVGQINSAADARLKIVRPRCLKFPEQGTQLLNEIAMARICLTDDEERATYDADLLATSTQDVKHWAQIHATFGAASVDSAQIAEVAAMTAGAVVVPPPVEEVESSTYDVRPHETPAPPISSGDDDAKPPPPDTRKSRWCPHCGTKLLPAATFCYTCSLAEISTASRMQLKCRACDKRQPTGMVICRKCKHDHALRGAQPKMPKRLLETTPYYVADFQTGAPDAQENAPVDLADINPTLSDDDFAQALKDEIGDQSDTPIHIKSRTREIAEKKVQKEAERKAAEEEAIANRPLVITLCNELVVYSQEHPVFMVTTVSVAILALIFTPFFFLRSGTRTPTPASPPPVAKVQAEQPHQLQAAETVRQPNPSLESQETMKTVAKSSAEPATPIDAAAEKVYEAARDALAKGSNNSKTLLEHREKLLTQTPLGPHRGRFEDLAALLLKDAGRRAESEHREAIGLANDDDDFRQIWRKVTAKSIGSSTPSRAERNLQKHLTDTWYQYQSAQMRTKIDGLFDLEQLEEAMALKDVQLPEELQSGYSQQWAKFIRDSLQTKLHAYINQIEVKVTDLQNAQDYTSALELLDETTSQYSNPPVELTQFVQKRREAVLSHGAMLGIRVLLVKSEFVQAQTLVEILLQHPTHGAVAKKYQQEMIKLKHWTAATPAPAAEKNVVRKNVKDPPRDYATDKMRVQSRLNDAGSIKRYNEWYRRLGIRHNQHRAGYFVLTRDNEQKIVGGLAAAAYEALLLDVPAAAGAKKSPVKSDWFGVLEDARQAYPDAAARVVSEELD